MPAETYKSTSRGYNYCSPSGEVIHERERVGRGVAGVRLRDGRAGGSLEGCCAAPGRLRRYRELRRNCRGEGRRRANRRLALHGRRIWRQARRRVFSEGWSRPERAAPRGDLLLPGPHVERTRRLTDARGRGYGERTAWQASGEGAPGAHQVLAHQRG